MSSEQEAVGSNPTGCTIYTMQKYVLVKLLEEVSEGTEFSMQDWPMHVTISPRFAVDWKATNLYHNLSELLAAQQPITTTAGQDEYFGANGQVHVTLLAMTPALQALHNQVLQVLSQAGAVFDEIQYTGKNYRAHVTVQKRGRVHKGDEVTINNLTIVDMFPGQDIKQRKILRTINFSV